MYSVQWYGFGVLMLLISVEPTLTCYANVICMSTVGQNYCTVHTVYA